MDAKNPVAWPAQDYCNSLDKEHYAQTLVVPPAAHPPTPAPPPAARDPSLLVETDSGASEDGESADMQNNDSAVLKDGLSLARTYVS